MIVTDEIYIVRCPIDNSIIYVGKTKNLKARIRMHIGRNNSNAPIAEYIRDLVKIGLTPIFQVVDTVIYEKGIDGFKNEYASSREAHWINLYFNDPNSRILNIHLIKKQL